MLASLELIGGTIPGKLFNIVKSLSMITQEKQFPSMFVLIDMKIKAPAISIFRVIAKRENDLCVKSTH